MCRENLSSRCSKDRSNSVASSGRNFCAVCYRLRLLVFLTHCKEVLAYCGIGLVASILGELAAGVWRVPVDLVPPLQIVGIKATFGS